MAELRIALMGSPHLTLEGGEINGRLPGKALVMLCYLACAGPSQSRSRLTGLLWGEKPEEDARRSLRVDLSKTRRILPDHLSADRQSVTFNQEADYHLDVESFEYMLKRAIGTEGATQRAILREAVALYRGDFLEGVVVDDEPIYEEWVLPERERLRQLVLQALDQLIAICMEQGDYEAGIRYAQRLLGLDQWREDAHRQLMRMYARNGQRTLALKQFEICRDVLEAEFGVPPTAATLALYQEILVWAEEQGSQPLTPLPAEAEMAPFLAPRLVPHFTGRTAKLAKLCENLLRAGQRRVYSLVGMPGAGKTALAIETAHVLSGEFPDGVLWANAATDDPKSVAERWANAYGYDFSRIPDLAERAAVLRDLLAEKQVLIIFDDVTGSVWVRAFIPDSKWCAVLLTMQDAKWALALQAEVVEVGGLSPEDGRSLLADILGEDRVEAEAETAATLYDMLQGLPLSLSLAAQRLAALPRRKLSWLVERLQVGLAEHGQAVKASFELSWEGLDESHQRIFAYLAVFAGRDFHVNALAAVAELERFPAYDRLDMLVTLSLLNEEEDGRYRQHALLALFAQEKLDGDDVPYRRMIAYYLDFSRDNQEDYAALRPEWENLSASIAQAHRLVMWQTVIGFTELLHEAWFVRGRFTEARTAFHLALQAAEALADWRAQAQCQLYWGHACIEQGEYDEARALLQNSLQQFNQNDDLAGEAEAKYHLSRLVLISGKREETVHLLQDSRRIWESLKDSAGIGKSLYQLARIALVRVDLQQAAVLARQALDIQLALNNKRDCIPTYRLLSLIATDLKEINDAEKYSNEALALCQAIGEQSELSVVYLGLVCIAKEKGNFAAAEEYGQQSIAILKRIGDRQALAVAYYEVCRLYEKMKRYNQAISWAECSLTLARDVNYPHLIALDLTHIGDCLVQLDQGEQAKEMWKEAMALAESIQHDVLASNLQKRLDSVEFHLDSD